MRYVTIQEIAAINTFVIQQYSPGEQIGIKDHHLLKFATFRPQSSIFGEDAYMSLFKKAAALFESLAQNYAFFNGNKRTALLALTFFLHYNYYQFAMATQKKIELTVDVVKHRYTFVESTQMIKSHVIYRKSDLSRVQDSSIDTKEARPFFQKQKKAFCRIYSLSKKDSSSRYEMPSNILKQSGRK